MANDNRARRAAKQRQRDARRAAAHAEQDQPVRQQDLGQLLETAARATAAGDGDAAEEAAFAALSRASAGAAQQQLTDLLVDCLGWTWRSGWQPADLHEITRRQLTKDHSAALADALGAAMAPYATSTVDPRWAEQLVPAGPAAQGRDPAWRVQVGLELLALLLQLPRIEVLLALPGAYRGERVDDGVDQKVLGRVRALLAKAESTEFDEEAEALSAKAQELMTRYSLDHLLVRATSQPVASARRLWLPTPYATAKALLVAAVGRANRCSVVWTEGLGYATVIGDEPDLAATEVLVTSLLVQASRAMLHGSPTSGEDKRSYRQSFLVAYAQRVGERLLASSEHVTDEAGGALVPVLAAQRDRVERTREQMFPSTKGRSVTVRNEAGYAAGRAAADRASF